MSGIVNGQEIKGGYLAGEEMFPKPEWELMKLGEGYKGYVFGKIDYNESTIQLVGNLSGPNDIAGKGARIVIMSDNRFEFNAADDHSDSSSQSIHGGSAGQAQYGGYFVNHEDGLGLYTPFTQVINMYVEFTSNHGANNNFIPQTIPIVLK